MPFKNLFISLLFVLVSVSNGWAEPQEETFVSSRYKCSIQGLENWRLDTSQKNVLVAFNYVDGVSSMTLRAYTMSEAPTANGVADRMSQSAYDGWVRMGGRKGNDSDIFITGADDKYEAVYKKSVLDETGKKITTIVGEAYYVKDNTAYILSATTTEYLFPAVKKDIKKILRSFYIDENL